MTRSTKPRRRQNRDRCRGNQGRRFAPADASTGSAHILARIIGLGRLPRPHQLGEVRIAVVRQCDAYTSEEVALALLPREALALRRNVRPELVPAGMASSTAPSRVGTR